MDNIEIRDALKIKECLESGIIDRLILKVQGKIADSLFKTETKEFKKREDNYITNTALMELKKEMKSLVMDYETKVGN